MSASPAPEAPAPSRPLLRWFGGKWSIAPWIISLMPPHEAYVEPFAGAASVLMRKPRSRIEVLGDLDDELLNLFRVVRDVRLCGRLSLMLLCTLYSEAEYELARQPAPEGDDVERARRMIVRHAMGRSGDVGIARTTGFRRYTGSERTAPAHDWEGLVDAIGEIRARLTGVVIERRDACETIRLHDREDCLHYVDPPYLPDTRKAARKGYRHELDQAGHVRLLDTLLTARGMVMLSGYAHPLYDDALAGWRRVVRTVRTQGMTAAEEVLWISPRAVAARDGAMMLGPRRVIRRRGGADPAQVPLF